MKINSFFFYYLFSYFEFFIFFFFIFFFCLLLVSIAYLLSETNYNFGKWIGYECGFDPFSDARDPFNVKFYLVAILFLLFDVELIFFFPFIFYFSEITFIGFFFFLLFSFVLILGYFYEWKKGCLNWDW